MSEQITVEFYGVLQEIAGTDRLDLPLTGEAPTIAEFVRGLEDRFPGLDRLVPRLAYALNDELVRPETTLAPGASLGLLPPVSGG